MHVMSGQHMSALVAGNTLSNGPTIRTLLVMRSMFLHIVRSCRPSALLAHKWKWHSQHCDMAPYIISLSCGQLHTLEHGTEVVGHNIDAQTLHDGIPAVFLFSIPAFIFVCHSGHSAFDPERIP